MACCSRVLQLQRKWYCFLILGPSSAFSNDSVYLVTLLTIYEPPHSFKKAGMTVYEAVLMIRKN